MSGQDLLTGFTFVRAEYIQESALDRIPRSGMVHKRRFLLIAAVVVLSLMLIGCAAVILLRLDAMQIDQQEYTRPMYYLEDGQTVPAAQTQQAVLSLQGILGSPSMEAAREWYEFEESYDPDRTLMMKADQAGFVPPEEYQAYGVYTQEMIDKVDEICQEYGLQLAGKEVLVQPYQQDVFFQALGLDGLLKEGSDAKMGTGAGYFYGCGNFQFEFDLTVDGTQLSASLRYAGKDYLDTVTLAMKDMGEVEEWNLTLEDGSTVLLVKNEKMGWIFRDREDAFLSLRLSSDKLTKEKMEQAAQAVDFSLKPITPDLEQAQKLLDEAEANYQAEQARLIQEAASKPWVNPFQHDSYADLIAFFQENSYFADFYGAPYDNGGENLYYSLMDLNGDGSAELLIGSQDTVNGIWTEQGSQVVPLIPGGETIYPCENGIWESYYFRDGSPVRHYWELTKETEMKDVAYLAYDANFGQWMYSDYSQPNTVEQISEAQAQQIIASFVRLDVEMRPIEEFLFE